MREWTWFIPPALFYGLVWAIHDDRGLMELLHTLVLVAMGLLVGVALFCTKLDGSDRKRRKKRDDN